MVRALLLHPLVRDSTVLGWSREPVVENISIRFLTQRQPFQIEDFVRKKMPEQANQGFTYRIGYVTIFSQVVMDSPAVRESKALQSTGGFLG